MKKATIIPLVNKIEVKAPICPFISVGEVSFTDINLICKKCYCI